MAATPKTIMTTPGPVTFRRARYRNGARSTSLVPVDESLGLIDDYLTRPAAQLGLMMMGHCTAREAEEFFAKMGGMTPSVSTLQRLILSMHERWESIAPEALDTMCGAEDIPPDAVNASVSLDGVMVALRAGEQMAQLIDGDVGGLGQHAEDDVRMRLDAPESDGLRPALSDVDRPLPRPDCASG